jgi:hypothetical protein
LKEAVTGSWWGSVKGRKEGIREREGGEGIGKGGGRFKLGREEQ